MNLFNDEPPHSVCLKCNQVIKHGYAYYRRRKDGARIKVVRFTPHECRQSLKNQHPAS